MESKILYSLMLDRASLSAKNGWLDEDGKVFIYYKLDWIMTDMHCASAYEFCEFFGVEKGNANRDLFEDFSAIFSRYIPSEKVIVKSSEERLLIGRRAEGNNPNAIYCFDVRRNGKKEDGTPNGRSVENSNKAEILRPDLYKRYFSDTNLSFFFSDDPTEERKDREIMESFAKRK